MNSIEKIRQEIKRLEQENGDMPANIDPRERDIAIGYNDALYDILAFINSLPEEKPIEKDDDMEALIACDIMEATVKRVNVDKQDKDKEEAAMLEKINYLRNLGLKAK